MIETNLVQRNQSIKFHDRKVVAESNERRDVNNILRPIPQMRQKLRSSRCGQPDSITRQNVPKQR